MSSNLTLSAIFIAAAAAVVSPAVESSDVDAPAYYRAALAAMQSIKEPAYLTYRTSVPAGDTTMLVSRGDDGRAELAVLAGESEAQAWDVAYRDADGTASIVMPDGTHVVSRLAIFDPTWRGAFTWLRRGLEASTPRSTPTPAQNMPPQSAPPSAAQSPPPVLVIVTAINETSYRISDGGARDCAGGRTGRRLFTTAKSDPLDHPMTEVVVDLATHRFCTMRFHEHRANAAIAFDLDIELHFGAIDRYYLITDGRASGAVRPYRRPGWFIMSTAFRYDEMAFPSRIPDALFVPQVAP